MSSRLGGRYQLVRELGAGGMGRVFQAVDTQTGKSVAAKVMIASGQDSLDALLRFYQEGAVLSTLKHPNIVEVYGTFLEEETCCIIMELLEGQSLGQILKSQYEGHQGGQPSSGDQSREHPEGMPRRTDGSTHGGAQSTPRGMPLSRVKRIAQQVTSALAYAHGRGIVHRDIKPDNIMLIGDDHVKVTDFGIARILRDGATLNTMTGTSIGTPLYMAPEQIEGQKVDGRADIYSLGAVLYQMITAQPPFTGTDPLTVAFKHVHRAPQPPTELNQEVPPEWERLVLRMLAKDPAERFQTAAALEEAIAALPAGGPGVAPTASPKPTVERPPAAESRQERAGADQVLERYTVAPSPGQTVIGAAASQAEVEPAVPRAETRPAAGTAAPEAAVSGEPGPSAVDRAPITGTPTKPRAAVPWPIVAGGAAAVIVALAVAFLLLRTSSPSSSTAKTPVPTNGNIIGMKGTGPGQFITPAGVALDTQGNIYVADTGNNRIQKLSSRGRSLASWGTKGTGPGQFNSPAAVAVDTQGTVYVADAGNSRIQELSAGGKPVAQWGTKGSGPGQLRSPAGVTVDPQGNVYVADTGNDRIVKLSPGGEPAGAWGSRGSGPGQFINPVGIAVDVQGDMFVADAGNNRIQELSPAGKPLGQWGTKGTSPGQFNSPAAIALDPQGDVYVADLRNNRIQELASTSDPMARWGTAGSGPGQFLNPAGLAVDPQGTIYVADAGNNRIQKIAQAHSNGG